MAGALNRPDVERIEALEVAAIEHILLDDSQPEIMDTLRHQYAKSKIHRRRFRDVGFSSRLWVDSDAPRLQKRDRFHLGNLDAEVEGLEYGLGFVLYVRDGWLETLEVFTYGETFPECLTTFRVHPVEAV